MKLDTKFVCVNFDEECAMQHVTAWPVDVLITFINMRFEQNLKDLANMTANIRLLEATPACKTMMATDFNPTAAWNHADREKWKSSIRALNSLRKRLQLLLSIVEHAKQVERQANTIFSQLFRQRDHALYLYYVLCAKQYELVDCTTSWENRSITGALSEVEGVTFGGIVSEMDRDFSIVREGVFLFDMKQNPLSLNTY